ncbi:hypothetical protein BVV10_00585 [Xanthomonas oryzae pv. oryzae]|nr:hypothetical protein BVV16_00585 [Xanthomonas oryzae pv. oryzae]AUI95936.1 hypothetical protein BVV17_00585 [Xanthomonas oryzae pv. oryzae]AUI99608.1 hypothetical protein BVV18_00590 [Xanthomonas oryzae pv. oryzae]AUJ03285.1 hypothetical protein BVV10_00585 [Xanthomonas oryzae pv. oryzae]AUJ06948.1 hypothetical protein BVV19_00590 [Xanthomonas oryzae pv. oryzae]
MRNTLSPTCPSMARRRCGNAAVPAAAAERNWPRVVMAISCNNVVHEHGPASVRAKPADSAHRQLL